MQENQAGVTALVTAYARAYHATHDSPKIFDDFLADQMYTAEEHTSFDYHLASTLAMIDPETAASQPDQAAALARVMQIHHAPVTLSRSRYTEDCLEASVQQGVQQYILLGAGLDTFAFRRSDLLDRLDVFEVDHPVTQSLKRQRITMAGWQTPDRLHFVPLDFTKDRLEAALLHSGYDPHKLSFFSWQGVTFYLPHEVALFTLQAIAGIARQGSQIVFDYMDADAFDPERASKRVRIMQEIASMVGEPMKTGFNPQELGDLLARLGLQLQENLGPSDIDVRYFQNRTDDYHAFDHVHFAKAAVAGNSSHSEWLDENRRA